MDLQSEYERLIQNHIKRGYLRDKSLSEFITKIPIYKIIYHEEDIKRFLMRDQPILCYYKNDNDFRTVSAPHMISIFLSMLELSPSDEILVLGAKGGFISSILSSIVHFVYIIEEHPEVAQITESNMDVLGINNFKLINKNPLQGLQDFAPFKKILITGAIKEIPDHIFEQLDIYGILVAPIIISKRKQQVIQFIKQYDGIQEINFGRVQFQELFHSKLKYIPRKIKEFSIKQEAFTDTYANLPKVQILDLAFNPQFNEKNKQLNINDPSYRIYYRIRNNSNKEIRIQVKLEMPSLVKDNISDKQILKPKSEVMDSIIIANPKSQGTHDFNLIVCDDNNYRLTKTESRVDIKKSTIRKILDFSLIILKMYI